MTTEARNNGPPCFTEQIIICASVTLRWPLMCFFNSSLSSYCTVSHFPSTIIHPCLLVLSLSLIHTMMQTHIITHTVRPSSGYICQQWFIVGARHFISGQLLLLLLPLHLLHTFTSSISPSSPSLSCPHPEPVLRGRQRMREGWKKEERKEERGEGRS